MRRPSAGCCPIAVIGLPAVLGIYPAVRRRAGAALEARRAAHPCARRRADGVSKWFRGIFCTGCSWRPPAVLGQLLPLAIHSLFGIWGLTFIAVVVFASPATLTDSTAKRSARGCR